MPEAPDSELIAVPGSDTATIVEGDGKWYRFVLDSPDIAIVSTGGSDFDTVMSLWDENGDFIEYDDEDGPGSTSLIERSLAAGTYYVFISGYDHVPGALNWTVEVDLFSAAGNLVVNTSFG